MSWWWVGTPATSSTWRPSWDSGIQWRSELVTPPTDLPLELSYVRDKVLRVVNGSEEDEHIESLIEAATAMCEEATQRALMPQTWEIILTGFPTAEIVLPRPPLIEVTSFGYIDADGNTQTLATSPLDFQVVPSGRYQKARLLALSGASWPTVGGDNAAVTIQFRCGYENGIIPADIRIGLELAVGELYKIRGLSVQAISATSPAVLQLDRFWRVVY